MPITPPITLKKQAPSSPAARAWHETPRTNALLQEIQSTPKPFDQAFWELLELTRDLEVEITRLKKPTAKNRQPKARRATARPRTAA